MANADIIHDVNFNNNNINNNNNCDINYAMVLQVCVR
mgnify:FL=1